MTYLTRRQLACTGLALTAFWVPTLSLPAQADSPARQVSKFASGDGNILFLAAGVGLPLLSDGHDGKNHSLRALDALGTSVLLSEGLKVLVREKRPDSNAHDSFPSGHATAAFAVATVESDLHPKQALLWYLGAALISYSRIRLHRHTVGDVLAGAALGAGTARVEMAQPRGLILSPFITPDGKGMGIGMTRGL
ncbi:MAG: phosphatase PAP2 family protein [Armatimonadota bacterium]|nr:phosphatase PAP2 family protein [Armatimonadota bacterium]